MALLYRASLSPSKLELLEGWAPSQPWFEGDASGHLSSVASYRFDDPEGEVGVETLLVRAGDGPVLQVPLTYRNERLDGADAWLIGTMQHSVLGERWTYDATGDPVYLLTLATAVLTGGHQADQFIEIDGVMTEREPTAVVSGSGSGSGGGGDSGSGSGNGNGNGGDRGDGGNGSSSGFGSSYGFGSGYGSGAAGTAIPALPAVSSILSRNEGAVTIVDAGSLHVEVARNLSHGEALLAVGGAATLTGTWTEHPESTTLATVRLT